MKNKHSFYLITSLLLLQTINARRTPLRAKRMLLAELEEQRPLFFIDKEISQQKEIVEERPPKQINNPNKPIDSIITTVRTASKTNAVSKNFSPSIILSTLTKKINELIPLCAKLKLWQDLNPENHTGSDYTGNNITMTIDMIDSGITNLKNELADLYAAFNLTQEEPIENNTEPTEVETVTSVDSNGEQNDVIDDQYNQVEHMHPAEIIKLAMPIVNDMEKITQTLLNYDDSDSSINNDDAAGNDTNSIQNIANTVAQIQASLILLNESL